jgi:hypothetical protein
MRKETPFLVFPAITVVAIVAVVFWAFRPFAPYHIMTSVNASDADVIRELFPYHLIDPSWFGSSVNYGQWAVAEFFASLFVVSVCWSVCYYLDERGFRTGILRFRA